MENVLKYLALFIVVVSIGVGCKIIEPTATLAEVDGQKFYIVKSGTSKGGGPVTTSIVAKEEDGSLLNVATVGGDSTGRAVLGAFTGVPSAIAGNSVAGYFIGRGLRKSGDSNTTSNTTEGSTATGGTSSSDGNANAGGGYAWNAINGVTMEEGTKIGTIP
jgi:hypothetical protein